ncbi:MAG: hypothetical protein HQK79_23310 [Desulfobacterales bacterium]|nr:hypothetical protein [Desulfobacterales bacterium]
MIIKATQSIKELRNKNKHVKLISRDGDPYAISGVLKCARKKMKCNVRQCEIEIGEIYIYSDFGEKLCLGCCTFKTGYEDKELFKGLKEDPKYDEENDYNIMEESFYKGNHIYKRSKSYDKNIRKKTIL